MYAVPIIAILGFFLTMITWIVFYYRDRRSSNAVEMQIPSSEIIRKKKLKSMNSLKYGLFLVLGSVGFILGVFIESLFGFGDALIALPMSFVGAGVGLILFYFMTMNMLKDEDEDEIV